MATKIGAAVLILAFLIGARGAAREIAAPFRGFDQLARTAKPQPPASEREPEVGIPMEAPIEPDPEPESETTLVNDTPNKPEWDLWKERAIAALPEDLRHDTDQRRAIDWLYFSAAGESHDELGSDIISRPPIGEYEIDGLGFTDIDDRADIAPAFVTRGQAMEMVYELRGQAEEPDAWAAFWKDWKSRAIAALPEAERNDPNRLKEIDTTLELARRVTGGTSYQVTQWKQIGFEVTLYQEKAQGVK